MLKVYTAFTEEIDDAELAVKEILEQIKPNENLLKNSVGIMNFYSEFAESGTAKAICDALPFEVLGCSALACGTSGKSSLMNLSLMVITSDDTEFSLMRSKSLLGGDLSSIGNAYEEAKGRLSGDPKLILAFFPLIFELGGDTLLEEFNRVVGGVPVFGTLSSDHLPDYSSSVIFINGEYAKGDMAAVIMAGNVNPRFIVKAVSDKKLQRQRTVITDSDKSLLKGVNNIAPLEYMKTLGLTTGNGIEGMNTIPFIVDFKDGTTPIARAMYNITDEGNIFCGGIMPVGGTLAVGSLEAADILETSQNTVNQILNLGEVNGVLMFPCLGRCAVLGTDMLAEFRSIEEFAGGKFPYILAYSGGELCPVYNEKGETFNRFHNFTMIACIL